MQTIDSICSISSAIYLTTEGRKEYEPIVVKEKE